MPCIWAAIDWKMPCQKLSMRWIIKSIAHPSFILSCLSLITKWSLITENRFGLYWSLTGSDSAEESRSYFKGDRSRMTTSWNSDLSASKMSSPRPSSSSETASVVWLPTKLGSAVSWLMYHLEYIFLHNIFFCSDYFSHLRREAGCETGARHAEVIESPTE